MIIKHATGAQIRAAVAAVAALFEGNIKAEIEARTRAARDGLKGTHRVKLGVKSSRAPGGRRSHKGRRIAAACWHAFGHFFDALPSGAIIDGAVGEKARPAGAPWLDRQIGSHFQPLKYSQACDCAGTGREKRQLAHVDADVPKWVSAGVAPARVPDTRA